MSTEIEVGQVVEFIRIKSPAMEVTSIDGEMAVCEWFGEDGTPYTRTYRIASLKVVPEQSSVGSMSWISPVRGSWRDRASRDAG